MITGFGACEFEFITLGAKFNMLLYCIVGFKLVDAELIALGDIFSDAL